MDVATTASIIAAMITGASAYFGIKSRRLPSKNELRREIEERLDGSHEIPTPLAARRHEDVNWSSDFSITVEDVIIYEQRKRRKWLPLNGFEGKTRLELRFDGREAISEKDLYNSFLGRHSQFEQINKHIDDPHRLDILVGTANPNTICGHIFGTFKRIVMELKLKSDNTQIDEDWLTHPKNTYLGYKNGNIYNIMDERVTLPILHPVDEEPPDNIPRKSAESGR